MDFFEPGPRDSSLLYSQNTHISNQVWDNEERMIRPRHRFFDRFRHPEEIDDRIRNLINAAGFGHILSIGEVAIDHHLITALVERWRPETHTFHFPYGEATVTLQDVALHLGLPIDGEAVTGVVTAQWAPICLQLLGDVPPAEDLKGSMVKITWFESRFAKLPANANDLVIAQYARAYIMMMIGGLLLPDTSGSRVHLMYLLLLDDLPAASNYSWGAAVLACLYRSLCRASCPKQIESGGCSLLLQSWAWDRIPRIAPRIQLISDEEAAQGFGFPLARRYV